MELINQAFVHSSYVNEHRWEKHDNERLEFMGDAVLQVWVSERMMRLQQPLSEGKMTTLRAQLVCEQSLAEYTRKLNLAQFLKLGMGEEKQVEEIVIPFWLTCLKHFWGLCILKQVWIRSTTSLQK